MKQPEKKEYKHHCEYFDCDSNDNGYCWACGWPAELIDKPCSEETAEQFEEYNSKEEEQ